MKFMGIGADGRETRIGVVQGDSVAPLTTLVDDAARGRRRTQTKPLLSEFRSGASAARPIPLNGRCLVHLLPVDLLPVYLLPVHPLPC